MLSLIHNLPNEYLLAQRDNIIMQNNNFCIILQPQPIHTAKGSPQIGMAKIPVPADIRR